MKQIHETIGLIGCGNMGGAILRGLLKNRLAKPGQIFVFDPDKKKINDFKKIGVHACGNNLEVINSAQIVILAIKPQEIYNLGKELKGHLTRAHTIVSILAGTKIDKINEHLGRRGSGVRFPIVRAMPNLPAKVGKAVTVITSESKAAITKAEIIFSACGEVIIMRDEKYFDLVTAVSGSGPAYFFLLMEILEKFACAKGLSESNARKLAIQTALGSAELATTSQDAPEILRRQVTSKGGTTEAALHFLLDGGVLRLFENALSKAERRAKELNH